MVIAQPQTVDAARHQSGVPDELFETDSVSAFLPGTPDAVRQARTLVRRGMAHLAAGVDADDVALAATELVANALEHGGPSGSWASCDLRRPAEGVRISLVRNSNHIVLSVTDASPEPPVRRPHDPLAGGGRGLQLVQSLSLCWGWTLLEEEEPDHRTPGKAVWAIFSRTVVQQPAQQMQIRGIRGFA